MALACGRSSHSCWKRCFGTAPPHHRSCDPFAAVRQNQLHVMGDMTLRVVAMNTASTTPSHYRELRFENLSRADDEHFLRATPLIGV